MYPLYYSRNSYYIHWLQERSSKKGVESSYRIPMEIKTGKMYRTQGSLEHRAQVREGGREGGGMEGGREGEGEGEGGRA